MRVIKNERFYVNFKSRELANAFYPIAMFYSNYKKERFAILTNVFILHHQPSFVSVVSSCLLQLHLRKKRNECSLIFQIVQFVQVVAIVKPTNLEKILRNNAKN